MRFVFAFFSLNVSVRCHEMAYPSRSSSVASQTVFAFAEYFFSSAITFFLSSLTTYTGSKLFFRSIPMSAFARSRTCPYDDLTVKSFPRNFSMVLAFAGDSTMTRFFDMKVVSGKDFLGMQIYQRKINPHN